MRFSAFACSVFLAAGLLLTGCGAAGQPASSSASLPPVSSSAAATPAPEPVWPADDFSALPESIQGLFPQAQTLYNYFELAPPPCDPDTVSVNGETVYHVSAAAYADYAAFYQAALGCFTPDYTEKELFGREEYLALDGALYTLVTPRDANSTFRWAQAQLVSQTDTEIHFTVTAHYYEAYLPEAERESTKTVSYTAVQTDAGWRFSEFGGYV